MKLKCETWVRFSFSQFINQTSIFIRIFFTEIIECIFQMAVSCVYDLAKKRLIFIDRESLSFGHIFCQKLKKKHPNFSWQGDNSVLYYSFPTDCVTKLVVTPNIFLIIFHFRSLLKNSFNFDYSIFVNLKINHQIIRCLWSDFTGNNECVWVCVCNRNGKPKWLKWMFSFSKQSSRQRIYPATVNLFNKSEEHPQFLHSLLPDNQKLQLS